MLAAANQNAIYQLAVNTSTSILISCVLPAQLSNNQGPPDQYTWHKLRPSKKDPYSWIKLILTLC
jgi:hypothetical protein